MFSLAILTLSTTLFTTPVCEWETTQWIDCGPNTSWTRNSDSNLPPSNGDYVPITVVLRLPTGASEAFDDCIQIDTDAVFCDYDTIFSGDFDDHPRSP